MDKTTQQWLDGMSNLEISGFILNEKEFISPDVVDMIVKEIKKKGIQFETDREKQSFIGKLLGKIISSYEKISG